MQNVKETDLYLQVELQGNALHIGEERVYDLRVEAETDKTRQKEMKSRKAMGAELGNQMGIVWAMHELYRAESVEDILAVKVKLDRYQELQEENLAKLTS